MPLLLCFHFDMNKLKSSGRVCIKSHKWKYPIVILIYRRIFRKIRLFGTNLTLSSLMHSGRALIFMWIEQTCSNISLYDSLFCFVLLPLIPSSFVSIRVKHESLSNGLWLIYLKKTHKSFQKRSINKEKKWNWRISSMSGWLFS